MENPVHQFPIPNDWKYPLLNSKQVQHSLQYFGECLLLSPSIDFNKDISLINTNTAKLLNALATRMSLISKNKEQDIAFFADNENHSITFFPHLNITQQQLHTYSTNLPYTKYAYHEALQIGAHSCWSIKLPFSDTSTLYWSIWSKSINPCWEKEQMAMNVLLMAIKNAYQCILKEQANTPVNILVVEDDPINRTIFKKILNDLGYEADFVTNGQAAVEQVRGTRYDIVFMDIEMPELDGISATRTILGMENIERPKIIMVTANTIQGAYNDSIQAGAVAYLKKPIHPNLIRETIEKYQCCPPS